MSQQSGESVRESMFMNLTIINNFFNNFLFETNWCVAGVLKADNTNNEEGEHDRRQQHPHNSTEKA